MPFKEQPLDITYAPPAYPQPDWSGTGLVAHAVTQNEIGYLVLQGDALAWVTTAAPATPEASLAQWLAQEIRNLRTLGKTAQQCWDELGRYLPGQPAAEMKLTDIYKED